MAVIEDYYSESGVHVRIHDDYLPKNAEEERKAIERVCAVGRKITGCEIYYTGVWHFEQPPEVIAAYSRP